MDKRQQLCYLQGVADKYSDFYGNEHCVSQTIREQLLAACGYDIDCDTAITDANFALDAAPWQQLLIPFQVCQQTNPSFKFRVHQLALNTPFSVTLYDHNKEAILKQVVSAQTQPETGNYFINDERYSEHQVSLPELVFGYYEIELTHHKDTCRGTLLVAPEKAYHPFLHEKLWGISLQLYSVKSDTNLGCGDFNDLLTLITLSAEKKADYLLLNPLHKLFEAHPEQASPYSPSDRMQINPLYISPLLSDDFKGELNQPSNSEWINYTEVWQQKRIHFKQMYQHFLSHSLQHENSRAQAFKQFCQQHAHWQLCQYEFYLQWQAHLQLAKCQHDAIAKGMKIGLVLDLAVGCNQAGEEYARFDEIFTTQANIGAPPDPWSRQGQNWGMPCIDPVKLKQSGYRHFIDLLKANMQHSGGLRVDHVMGLLRLWWCIQHQQQQQGCYMYYPFADLIAILKCESHLNRCIIIGEDLGVVPPEIIHTLSDNAILGNDIFYFEKYPDGRFKQPHELRNSAMLMLANHDVPPFYAWWEKHDIQQKQQYHLYPSDDLYQQEITQRQIDKNALLDWLSTQESAETTDSIFCKVIAKLATSNTPLLCVQLDDLDKATTAINIPGTDSQYPNWRRRINHTLNQLFDNKTLFDDINLGRNHAIR